MSHARPSRSVLELNLLDAPDIFRSIGITGSNTSLLASGIYGIVKIVATAIFVFFGIERFGRRWSLTVGLALMSLFLWIIGAIFNTNRELMAALGPFPHEKLTVGSTQSQR